MKKSSQEFGQINSNQYNSANNAVQASGKPKKGGSMGPPMNAPGMMQTQQVPAFNGSINTLKNRKMNKNSVNSLQKPSVGSFQSQQMIPQGGSQNVLQNQAFQINMMPPQIQNMKRQLNENAHSKKGYQSMTNALIGGSSNKMNSNAQSAPGTSHQAAQSQGQNFAIQGGIQIQANSSKGMINSAKVNGSSRSKSVHHQNNQSSGSAYGQNQTMKRPIDMQNTQINGSQQAAFIYNQQQQNLANILNQNGQKSTKIQKQNRSHSDNFNHRKQQKNLDGSHPSNGGNGSSSKNQKMIQLNNKLQTIYNNNNQGMMNQVIGSSQLNTNMGQISGMPSQMGNHQRGQPIGGNPQHTTGHIPQTSQIPTMPRNQMEGLLNNRNEQLINKFNNLQISKAGNGKIYQSANGTMQNKMINKNMGLNQNLNGQYASQQPSGSQGGLNSAQPYQTTQTKKDRSQIKTGQSRSHSTQINNQGIPQPTVEGQHRREQTFNKSHGRLPSATGAEKSNGQNKFSMTTNQYSDNHHMSAQNLPTQSQDQQKINTMHRRMSPKRSGQLNGNQNQNVGSSTLKTTLINSQQAIPNRARSGGHKSQGQNLPIDQQYPAAPASGVNNSITQLPKQAQPAESSHPATTQGAHAATTSKIPMKSISGASANALTKKFTTAPNAQPSRNTVTNFQGITMNPASTALQGGDQNQRKNQTQEQINREPNTMHKRNFYQVAQQQVIDAATKQPGASAEQKPPSRSREGVVRPSSGKQRVPSAKRLPSAKSNKSKKDVPQETTAIQPQLKLAESNPAQVNTGIRASSENPRSSLPQKQAMPNANNMRRSRNGALADTAASVGDANPTSAGQSVTSIYKQEQFAKKYPNAPAAVNNKNDQPQQPPVTLQNQNQRVPSTKSLQQAAPNDKQQPPEEPRKPTPKKKDPVVKKGQSPARPEEGLGNKKPSTNDLMGANKEKQQQDKQPSPKEPQNTGLSGRNLYFQQIRNEITLSEQQQKKQQQAAAGGANGQPVPSPQVSVLPDYQNAKFSNKRNGLVAGYGANTNQGIVRNYNEDRVAIILNIMKPKSKNYENHQWPKCSFFGIYDGHGGAVCADFLRDYLHQFIIKDENFPQNPIQALRNGFREAERLFLEFAESQEKEAGDIDRSGSCAVVILIIDDMCYCANTGDSRAIMSADGGEKLFLLSTDHKPTEEVEMKRIIDNGGRIYQNSQVIQTNPALGEAGKQVVYGPHRVFPGRLSVSRTIGDIEAKIGKYEGNPNVVIADPDVTAFEIKDNHDFIIVGCDGIYDKLSSKDAIHIAWQKVLMEANKEGVKKVDLEKTHNNCGHCVDGILRTAALRRTVDNVTCVVVAFDGFQKQLQKFIDKNLDGTTVDVIEEIQLEPIPEYLSNQRMGRKRADNSMLLLDEDQPQDKDIPNGLGRLKKDPKGGAKDQLLSEIAEEDDLVSSISETTKNPYGAVKNNQGTFGTGGRSSVASVKSVKSTSKLSAANGQSTPYGSNNPLIEQKRRSQMVPGQNQQRNSANNIELPKQSISSTNSDNKDDPNAVSRGQRFLQQQKK